MAIDPDTIGEVHLAVDGKITLVGKVELITMHPIGHFAVIARYKRKPLRWQCGYLHALCYRLLRIAKDNKS